MALVALWVAVACGDTSSSTSGPIPTTTHVVPTSEPTPAASAIPTFLPTPVPSPTPILVTAPPPSLVPNPTPTPSPMPSPTPTLIPSPVPSPTPTPFPAPEQFVFQAKSISPSEILLSWSLNIDNPTKLTLFRDNELLVVPSLQDHTFQDQHLSPNKRYTYRLVLGLPDGTEAVQQILIATRAHRPLLSRQMGTHRTGLSQPIVDELNPDYTEYLVSLRRREGFERLSFGWSNSKCRTFTDLIPGSTYQISVVARNVDGIMTTPASHYAEDRGGVEPVSLPRVHTWRHSGTEDHWVKAKIDDVARSYGLTDEAVAWMNNDIYIERRRGEPGWAGYIKGYVGVGQGGLGTLMHETMHAFWEYWDGFPQPCDEMNTYTFRRDVAQFALDFRDFELSGADNPLSPWLPYYNRIVHPLAIEPLDEEDFWDVISRGEYGRLNIWHSLETSIPGYNPNHPILIPPQIRKYFHGFMKDGERRTWEEELDWYTRLGHKDRILWSGFLTHEILYYSPHLGNESQDAPMAQIPEPLKTVLEGVDRQLLVDFINTFQDQRPWGWWNESPRFWILYVRHHLYLSQLYSTELGASVGIELNEHNLEAVLQALQALRALHCPPHTGDCRYLPEFAGIKSKDQVIEEIGNIENLSGSQRSILLEMVDLNPD